MKKNSTKMKLLSAAGMLAMSAAMLATSTYAWFTMNTEVSVTGMQLTAKSNSAALLINTGDNDTADEIQAAGATTVDLSVNNEDVNVYPSSPALTDEEVEYLTVAEGHNKVGGGAISTAGVKVTTPATAAAVTNWFTADALASNAATIDTATAKQLTSFDGYVIRKTAYLTVADGSNPVNGLTVKPTFAQKTGGTDITAAKVVVTTSDGGFAVLSSAQNGTAVDIKGSDTSLTDSTVLTVYFYIYYDGDETPVYTNNMANLKGADFQCVFDVTPVES